jgi:hypothetical protein
MRSLWPDLEMIARREGHGVEGREMRFGESWGDLRSQDKSIQGLAKRLDRPENPLHLSYQDLAFLTAATSCLTPQVLRSHKKSPNELRRRWMT